jgi:hypothetical protein
VSRQAVQGAREAFEARIGGRAVERRQERGGQRAGLVLGALAARATAGRRRPGGLAAGHDHEAAARPFGRVLRGVRRAEDLGDAVARGERRDPGTPTYAPTAEALFASAAPNDTPSPSIAAKRNSCSSVSAR